MSEDPLCRVKQRVHCIHVSFFSKWIWIDFWTICITGSALCSFKSHYLSSINELELILINKTFLINSYNEGFVVVCCSVTELCQLFVTPCIPGFPALRCILELAQTHVHWAGDTVQPSCPLSSPSPPTFNLSQQQGLNHVFHKSFYYATKHLFIAFLV